LDRSYQDVGLSIEASVDAYADGGLRLRSKVEQSNVSQNKSGFSAQDPVFQIPQLRTANLELRTVKLL